MTLEPWYHLDITNLETVSMFFNIFKGWFAPAASNYNDFIRALLDGNVKAMNLYMNDVALVTFSHFDSGKIASERTQPERFYHGLVLGLLVEVRDRYSVRLNRESGFGRYDVMLIPKNEKDNEELLNQGIAQERIRHYGFAFEGKKVLIG